MFRLKKKLKVNEQFKIDEEAINRILQIPFIYSYSVERVKVGDIRRVSHGVRLTLPETNVYHYMVSGDKAGYTNYIQTQTFDSEKKSIKKFRKLKQDLQNNIYDIKRGAIVLNKDNVLIDGFHRSMILYNTYGPDFAIDVVKVFYPEFNIKSRVKQIFLLHK